MTSLLCDADLKGDISGLTICPLGLTSIALLLPEDQKKKKRKKKEKKKKISRLIISPVIYLKRAQSRLLCLFSVKESFYFPELTRVYRI